MKTCQLLQVSTACARKGGYTHMMEDVPLMSKIAQQLDRMYEQSEQHLQLFAGYLSRTEQREENAEARWVRVEESLESMERSLAEIGRQTSKLARTAAEAVEAWVRAGEMSETRLKRLEGRSMLRRNATPRIPEPDLEPDETEESEERDPPPRRAPIDRRHRRDAPR